MSIKMLDRDAWLVQVQRAGVRRTRRGAGGEAAAKLAEAQLVAEMEEELKLADAARLLGVDRAAAQAAAAVPTVREFFEARWVEHAKVVQNATTRRTQRSAWNYVIFHVGDRKLDELLRPSEINAFVEAMKTGGPVAFAVRKDGKPWRRRVDELTNATINKPLQCLKALLRLAHAEGVIPAAPKIDLLPEDDSTPVLPPSEQQFRKLLAACEDYRRVSPILPEFVEFATETGLRRGELLHLSWGSVDLARGAVRVEAAAKSRVVNGQVWTPKHRKFREVPLSKRARAIIDHLHANEPNGPHDLVFPNKGGAPFERTDGAPRGSGHGWFPDAVEAAGLKGKVNLHGMRHIFAVRLLTRGVPITVVSELLGHSDINLTVKRYGRFASDAQVKWDAVKVLDEPVTG